LIENFKLETKKVIFNLHQKNYLFYYSKQQVLGAEENRQFLLVSLTQQCSLDKETFSATLYMEVSSNGQTGTLFIKTENSRHIQVCAEVQLNPQTIQAAKKVKLKLYFALLNQ
jgi:hypothetical protein